MEIKDQVLSIEQIKELRELGFDFKKYSSACVIGAKDRNKYIVDKGLIVLHMGFMEIEVIEYHETLTIGDIIECLPEEIEEKILNIFAFGETWSVGWEGIQYYGSNTLIDALFETLKWCIKEKHIEL